VLNKRVFPHLLRHRWMSEVLRRGMNPMQLSFIAGASAEVIALHYTHLTRDDAYGAMLRALLVERGSLGGAGGVRMFARLRP
jgi:hypothetical protein